MSVAEHHALSPTHVACFVLSMSDTRTAAQDTSAQAIVDLLEAAGHGVVGRERLKDEPTDVTALVRRAIARRAGGRHDHARRTTFDLAPHEIERRAARVIITTGGTGIAKR